jgi:hypothetical protein
MTIQTISDRHWNEVPWLLRKLGCWGIQDNGTCFRFNWGEVSLRFGLAIGYGVYHDDAHWRIHLGWPAIYIKAPMLITQGKTHEDWNASYGVTFFERGIHFNWRSTCKIIYLPWDWQHVRCEVFRSDGVWVEPTKHCYEQPYPDGRLVESHPFTYVLRDGTVQRRTATIYGEEREWRWRWFQWLPWPRLVKRCISITFDDEVGERTGSWKGGTIGCSAEWRAGEPMLAALRRMEATRKFN